MSILLAFIVISILLACGFLTAVAVLGERDFFAVTGMTFVFGFTTMFLLANGLAFALPIRSAFVTAMLLIAALDAGLAIRLVRSSFQWSQIVTNRSASIVLFAVILLTGIVHLRFVGSDPWSWQHFPLAATIVEGNFPVMSPIDPLRSLRYHYAPAFFAAGFRLLTGLPLSFGFGLQPLIGGAGILCFVAAAVRGMRGSLRVSLIAAVSALAGSGLLWLKGPELLVILSALTLQIPVREGFSVLWNLVSSPLTVSPFLFLGHRSTAMGFPLLFGLLWSLGDYLTSSEIHRRRMQMLIGFVFALGLTLTMELAFVTVSTAAVLAAAVFLMHRSTRTTGVRMIVFGVVTLVPALIIGLFHGGVLSGLFDAGTGHSFVFHPSFRITYDTYGMTAVPWDLAFLRDFGVPLFLFPFAAAVAWKRRRDQPLWIILCLLGIIHFLLPFFVEYRLILGEMRRSFYVSTSIFSLLAGVCIAEFFLASRSRTKHIVGIGLLSSMLLSAILYAVLRLVIPTGRLEAAPLLAGLPPVTAEQQSLYAWVREQTDPDDFFYVRNLTVHFEGLDTQTVQMRDRILFTTYTGRFTVGPIIYWEYDAAWLKDVILAEETCGADVMRRLGVRYLLVETQDRAIWFRRCRSADWSLRYDGDDGDVQYPRIYEFTAKES